MIYEFLKDFHRRMEIIAIVEFITSRIGRKVKLREYGFGNYEAINLVIAVLCYIMEKSLVEEICTKSNIASFIRRLDRTYLNKGIDDKEYLEMADYIIRECLQNNGIPHYFTTFNYEIEKEEKINIKLVDDRRVTYAGENVYSYYMTPQGYKFMFNTLEIEEAMKVSIEQFKLSISIKKRNFNLAKNNVDNLYNMCKTQIQKINYFIKKLRKILLIQGSRSMKKFITVLFCPSMNKRKVMKIYMS